MPVPLNAHCFAEPHWRVKARGFDPDVWVRQGRAVGTGGILMPQEIHLPIGQYYYRFASSKRSIAEQLGGAWWVDFENFRTIRSFAQAHGHSLHGAARLMLALPYAWTDVDRLVRAFLKVPLKAYTGYGKPALGAADVRDRGTSWVPTQHIKLRQLYIPGLLADDMPAPTQQLYEMAFRQPVEVTAL
jgi:hypothetical protein